MAGPCPGCTYPLPAQAACAELPGVLGPATCVIGVGTAPQLALKPAAQGVYGDEVGLELAVGVEEQSTEPGHEARGTSRVGAQEDTSAVIVVGVEVVPDDGAAPQDTLHLLQQRG